MISRRRKQIRALIEREGEVQLRNLKDSFPQVSMMTLRRDLDSLEKEGHVIRTHGGAVSVRRLMNSGEEHPYETRAGENRKGKQAIAKRALPYVEKNRSLFFDAGSTVMCLAEILPNEEFSVLTSGLNIAIEILKRSKPLVMTVGGSVNRNTFSVSGPRMLPN